MGCLQAALPVDVITAQILMKLCAGAEEKTAPWRVSGRSEVDDFTKMWIIQFASIANIEHKNLKAASFERLKDKQNKESKQ